MSFKTSLNRLNIKTQQPLDRRLREKFDSLSFMQLIKSDPPKTTLVKMNGFSAIRPYGSVFFFLKKLNDMSCFHFLVPVIIFYNIDQQRQPLSA